MNCTRVEQLADAVLYEGYNLYPYRPSALKNRHRWLFGCVLPQAWCDVHQDGERWAIQTQCLLLAGASSRVEVQVRFLQPVRRAVGQHQDAADRRITGEFGIAELLQRQGRLPISSSASRTSDALPAACGLAARERISFSARALVECEQCADSPHLVRLTVRIENVTELPEIESVSRDDALLQSLVSTHVILRAVDGEFVSLIDPPEQFRDAADACENVGLWPVLAGDAGCHWQTGCQCHPTMLAAPIILPDFPRIAPESPGDLFDGTEIDELLSLRIQTLTDAEKREAAAADERTRALLHRTDALDAASLRSLHGTSRPVRDFQPGDRVRLRPQRRADAFDLLLDGKTAVIAAVERDFEDCVHLAVTIDDDPGRDLGARGMPGHRFFFRPDEVELVPKLQLGNEAAAMNRQRILIAGVGNVFKGDDGFGVEVVRALSRVSLPDDVAVADFGIRGVDLAFAMSEYEIVILVDAIQRGRKPGSVTVIQPDFRQPPDGLAAIQGHNFDPWSVLAATRTLAASGSLGAMPDVYIVGCEPAHIPNDEELFDGLSPPVRAAVGEAVESIQQLIAMTSVRNPREGVGCPEFNFP